MSKKTHVPGWKQALKAAEEADQAPAVRMQLGVTVRAAEELPDGVLRFVMNRGTEDRGGDIIHHDGTRLENFSTNPVMPWGHDYHGLPLGTWSNVHVDGKDLVGDAHFESREVWDFAELVFQLYQRKILRACSVGIQPIVWAWNEERGAWAVDFLEQDLLECSAVMIGQHQDALVVQQQAREAGLDFRPALREAERILAGENGAGLWVPRSTLEAMAKSPSAPVVFDLAGESGRELLAAVAAKDEGGEDEEGTGATLSLTVHLAEALSVAVCGVCGERHDSLPVQARSLVPEDASWTHWGICPETSDPVYFNVAGVSTDTPATGADDELDEERFLVELDRSIRGACGRAAAEATTARTGALVYDDE